MPNSVYFLIMWIGHRMQCPNRDYQQIDWKKGQAKVLKLLPSWLLISLHVAELWLSSHRQHHLLLGAEEGHRQKATSVQLTNCTKSLTLSSVETGCKCGRETLVPGERAKQCWCACLAWGAASAHTWQSSRFLCDSNAHKTVTCKSGQLTCKMHTLKKTLKQSWYPRNAKAKSRRKNFRTGSEVPHLNN